jgi:hypothetical protein
LVNNVFKHINEVKPSLCVCFGVHYGQPSKPSNPLS